MSFWSGTLSQFWLTVQGGLFPWLAEELGELSEKQKQLVGILELVQIESFIKSNYGYAGRPQEDRRAIARAFVAKAVYNLETTRQLLERVALADDYFIKHRLYPNVDFYSGIIYSAIGFPVEMFPVLFAIGRTPGWLAQWQEGLLDPEQKIARPRQVYTGPAERHLPGVREPAASR